MTCIEKPAQIQGIVDFATVDTGYFLSISPSRQRSNIDVEPTRTMTPKT
jgi:hypothetical protein